MIRKKDKKEKAFSGLRGFPPIPPGQIHDGRRRKKGPYNRRKEQIQLWKKIKEEVLYGD